MCDICEEPFEQFWEEDLEEWHFKDAVRAEDSKVSRRGDRSQCWGRENNLSVPLCFVILQVVETSTVGSHLSKHVGTRGCLDNYNISLVPCAPPGKKRSGERSWISLAYFTKVVMTNEIARSVIIT